MEWKEINVINIFLDFLEEDGVEGGEEREYLESPMSDGTIEEDFEEALARYFFTLINLLRFSSFIIADYSYSENKKSLE